MNENITLKNSNKTSTYILQTKLFIIQFLFSTHKKPTLRPPKTKQKRKLTGNSG